MCTNNVVAKLLIESRVCTVEHATNVLPLLVPVNSFAARRRPQQAWQARMRYSYQSATWRKDEYIALVTKLIAERLRCTIWLRAKCFSVLFLSKSCCRHCRNCLCSLIASRKSQVYDCLGRAFCIIIVNRGKRISPSHASCILLSRKWTTAFKKLLWDEPHGRKCCRCGTRSFSGRLSVTQPLAVWSTSAPAVVKILSGFDCLLARHFFSVLCLMPSYSWCCCSVCSSFICQFGFWRAVSQSHGRVFFFFRV